MCAWGGHGTLLHSLSDDGDHHTGTPEGEEWDSLAPDGAHALNAGLT